jgi:MGT family glycosyltransferase
MECVVSSAGSAGDFLPTLTVAAALRRRGHGVRFVANPFYEHRIRKAGIELVPAGEPSDLYEKIEKNPAYSEPANAGLLLSDFVRPNTVATIHVIREILANGGVDVVLANNVSFGAIWAAAERSVPSVVVHATPLVWMGWHAPAVLGDRQPPKLLSRATSAAARSVMYWYLSRFLRPLGRELAPSLPDTSYAASERMVALQLAMWSPLVRDRVTGDPENATFCGFTRASMYGASQSSLAPELEAFLAAGPPPVVIGLGSVFSLTAGKLLTTFAEACADQGQRCLIAGHPSGLSLPSNTMAVRYAPYEHVFPRAAAVAGHGGAGTTGEILRSGKPALILPFAYDQFSLSRTVEELGVGVHVPLAKRSRQHLGEFLARVLADERLRARAAEVGPQFAAERDGAEAGAEAIEALLAQRQTRNAGAA